MDDNSYPQKLLAEVIGTATLVFIGVGSVPATLIIGGTAPFTMAQLGMISLAFAMAVVAMVYAIGHISGCQINPAITRRWPPPSRCPGVRSPDISARKSSAR